MLSPYIHRDNKIGPRLRDIKKKKIITNTRPGKLLIFAVFTIAKRNFEKYHDM